MCVGLCESVNNKMNLNACLSDSMSMNNCMSNSRIECEFG